MHPLLYKDIGKFKWIGKCCFVTNNSIHHDGIATFFHCFSVTVGSTLLNSSMYAIADTSTTFIVGPVAAVTILNQMLDGKYDSFTAMVD